MDSNQDEGGSQSRRSHLSSRSYERPFYVKIWDEIVDVGLSVIGFYKKLLPMYMDRK